MSKNYIGFGTAEKFLNSISVGKPINVTSITEAGRFGKHGLCWVTEAVVMSQVNGEEVLYCYIPTGGFHSMDGQRAIGDEDRTAKARAVWGLTLDWLKANDINYREAILAMPKNYKYIHASQSYMKYVKAEDAWTGLY